MLILIHVIIALVSTVLATVASVRPSVRLIAVNYSLIGMTVVTGTVLIVAESSNILKSCLAGLAYIAVVSALSVIAHRKLRHVTVNEE